LRRLDYRRAADPQVPGSTISAWAAASSSYARFAIRGGISQVPRDGAFPGRTDLTRRATGRDVRRKSSRRTRTDRGFRRRDRRFAQPLRLEEAPPLLVQSLIAVEDHRFWRHPGIDPISLSRALVNNLRRGAPQQGGSTLTQQLARSLFLYNRKTMFRKATEAVLAVALEVRYSKREILEAY